MLHVAGGGGMARTAAVVAVTVTVLLAALVTPSLQFTLGGQPLSYRARPVHWERETLSDERVTSQTAITVTESLSDDRDSSLTATTVTSLHGKLRSADNTAFNLNQHLHPSSRGQDRHSDRLFVVTQTADSPQSVAAKQSSRQSLRQHHQHTEGRVRPGSFHSNSQDVHSNFRSLSHSGSLLSGPLLSLVTRRAAGTERLSEGAGQTGLGTGLDTGPVAPLGSQPSSPRALHTKAEGLARSRGERDRDVNTPSHAESSPRHHSHSHRPSDPQRPQALAKSSAVQGGAATSPSSLHPVVSPDSLPITVYTPRQAASVVGVGENRKTGATRSENKSTQSRIVDAISGVDSVLTGQPGSARHHPAASGQPSHQSVVNGRLSPKHDSTSGQGSDQYKSVITHPSRQGAVSVSGKDPSHAVVVSVGGSSGQDSTSDQGSDRYQWRSEAGDPRKPSGVIVKVKDPSKTVINDRGSSNNQGGVFLSVKDPGEGGSQGGHWESLKQGVQGADSQTHVPRMVLTVIGSLTAVVGVIVMAAIFQCCCRGRKRSGSASDEEDSAKKEQQQQQQEQRSQRSSRSKSPSPLKATNNIVDSQDLKGPSEQDKLLEEDPDLGDFSMVQRETEILRSYRKPPPPKNRARASRVPRGVKAADHKANPDALKDLVEKEEGEVNGVTKREHPDPPTPSKALTPPAVDISAMHSSMLDDIDHTLAALHDSDDDLDNNISLAAPTPSSGKNRSREGSADRSTAGLKGAALKPPGRDGVSKSPSREELAKVLAAELSRSVSREVLSSKHESRTESPKPQTTESSKPQSKESTPKPQSKESTPKPQSKESTPKPQNKESTPKPQNKESTPKAQSKESTPKSQSAAASPKLGIKLPSASHSQDNAKATNGSSGAGDRNGLDTGAGASGDKKQPSPEREGAKDSGNIFALIDPTVKAGEGADRNKSKIPTRAASSPTQPTALLRPGSGKEKRFPVPSVHGDQMDQLLKSLKTRLKEDSPSAKPLTNKVSPQDEPADSDLDPHGRNRSNSDPSRQQDEKKTKLHQTHL